MSVAEISSFLDAIHAFYEEHAPFMLDKKIEPATPEAIQAFEEKTGFSLPEGYKDFLLRSDLQHSFIFNYDFLSLSRVESSWQIMTDLLEDGTFDDGRIEHHEKGNFGNWKGKKIRKVWWSKGWIPISEDGCGNMYCIDCDPGPNGTKFQLMQMEVQDGQGPFISQYASFEAYLTHHLQLLADGKYEIEHEPEYNWGNVMIDPYM